ncbi:hypothetical protein L249_3500 [Ophiocordyceps polyrhachis-furcata BCC 54312]|uniref:BTB domain-containing protein n=1 Tax=Ophiocordyceps polyrhachis-furcata BCC 54312 TaxID=1330021 RepID=A0A367LMR5_9HYPO|nr:hypothetical protein L249_3500 [Ophiocordyceps polyrhachis-furcata BCC 54312]
MTTASKDARLLHRCLTNKSLPPIPRPAPPPTTTTTTTTTTVLVGSEKTRFKLDRDRLCAVSAFFHDRLGAGDGQLWLPAESAAAFGLLAQWLHESSSLDGVVALARARGSKAARELHWPLVSLHLLASRLHVHQLQDHAMDLLQDLYLACNWHVAPSLVAYLYTKCDVIPAVRIRRWVVAMVAAASDDEDDVGDETRTKFGSLPDFVDDYHLHLAGLARAGLDVRLKDPRRRIACNRLRNHGRRFAFRQCSFHVHRAAVGEGPCPHARGHDSCSADEDGKPVL